MRSLRLALCLVASVALPLATGCGSHDDEGAAPSAAGADLSAKPKSTAKASDARFHQLKSGPTDKTLALLSTAGNKVDSALVGTYKFLKPTNEGSDAGARETRVKEVMHRFMCSFFDESIDIDHRSGASAVTKVVDDLDLSDNDDGDTSAIQSALTKIATDGDLDMMSGSASGNNTIGNVLGVYDKKNNEILFFGFSNCGSDD